jgi:hypothetical protein
LQITETRLVGLVAPRPEKIAPAADVTST